jgi:hypothetical protein
MKEIFIKNSPDIIKYLETKINENRTPEKVSTTMYSMNIMIDYKKLLKEMNTTIIKMNSNKN